MSKQPILSLSQLSQFSLYSIAGLAIAGDKVALSLLGDNVMQTVANKSLAICEPDRGAICLQAIYKTVHGLIVKVEGVQKMDQAISAAIATVARMMDEQKLSYVCFPGFSRGESSTFHYGNTTSKLMAMSGISDVQIYGEKVLFLQVTDQKQLKETTILKMIDDSSWKRNAMPGNTFPEKVRGLARISKDGVMEATLIDNRIMTYVVGDRSITDHGKVAPQNTVALGEYKLSDDEKTDHGVNIFVSALQMLFNPVMAYAPAAG